VGGGNSLQNNAIASVYERFTTIFYSVWRPAENFSTPSTDFYSTENISSRGYNHFITCYNFFLAGNKFIIAGNKFVLAGNKFIIAGNKFVLAGNKLNKSRYKLNFTSYGRKNYFPAE
jgi:hypothetical protein